MVAACAAAVITAEASLCRGSKYVKALPPHGFLSNLAAAETGCGAPSSPWLVEASPGLRVNVTLWDFAVAAGRLSGGGGGEQASPTGGGSGGCVKYATLAEMDQQHSRPKVE